MAVGKRLPMTKQPNAFDKATGKAVYTVDLTLPRMLHAKILRSPHAHAKILRVDASRAAKMAGVQAVLTYRDVPQEPYSCSIPELKEMYTLHLRGGRSVTLVNLWRRWRLTAWVWTSSTTSECWQSSRRSAMPTRRSPTCTPPHGGGWERTTRTTSIC